MADNNEADALFATRRKRQQEAEAEKERLEELDRQKQQVAEEIKRLENIRALQEEEAKQQAEEQKRLEIQRQYEEEQERIAQAKREEFINKSMMSKAEKVPRETSGGTNSKKLFLYGGIALGVVVLAVVIILIISMNSGDKKKSDSSSDDTGKKTAETDKNYEEDRDGDVEDNDYPDNDDNGNSADEDGDGYVSFKEKTGSYSYVTASIPGTDASRNATFVYPDFFKEYSDSQGNSMFACYDETSEQYVYFRYKVIFLENDLSAAIADSERVQEINNTLQQSISLDNIGDSLLEDYRELGNESELDLSEYRVYTLGDAYVEGMTTFDDCAYGDVIPMVLVRVKGDFEAIGLFFVTVGDVGDPVLFTDTDVEKLFEIMVDNTDFSRG